MRKYRSSFPKIDDPVVIPAELDTGLMHKISDEAHHVTVDVERLMKAFERSDLREIGWKARNKNGTYLMIARTWLDVFRRRRIRVQKHKIYTDGHIGGRIIIIDRVNGRPVRLRW